MTNELARRRKALEEMNKAKDRKEKSAAFGLILLAIFCIVYVASSTPSLSATVEETKWCLAEHDGNYSKAAVCVQQFEDTYRTPNGKPIYPWPASKKVVNDSINDYVFNGKTVVNENGTIHLQLWAEKKSK